jgi:hypothetical protein
MSNQNMLHLHQTSDIIPTIPYSDLISWVKYGRDYQYEQSEPILPSPELKNVMVECMTQFLCTDMNNFKSFLFDPRTFESLKALIRHHKYDVSCEDLCQRFSTMVQQDDHNIVFLESLEKLALGASSIPLPLFTHLLHQSFPTRTYFEGTVETIQQSEFLGVQICIESTHIFPLVLSDSKFSLNCRRCRKNICCPGAI